MEKIIDKNIGIELTQGEQIRIEKFIVEFDFYYQKNLKELEINFETIPQMDFVIEANNTFLRSDNIVSNNAKNIIQSRNFKNSYFVKKN